MQLSLPLGLHSKLSQVRDRLLHVYGPQRDTVRDDPTSQFFHAIISSKTLDAISNDAFWRLRASLSSWEALPDLERHAVATTIHDVTNALDKADYLIRAGGFIRAYHGRIDLEFLAYWPVGYAFHWLDHLPGAGPKVAAATLNFSSLRKRVFVVDTHVLRTSHRLGLASDPTDFERGYRTLMRLVPDDWDADDLYELHWLIKMHGQGTCRHHRPICAGCRLADLCVHSNCTRPPMAR